MGWRLCSALALLALSACTVRDDNCDDMRPLLTAHTGRDSGSLSSVIQRPLFSTASAPALLGTNGDRVLCVSCQSVIEVDAQGNIGSQRRLGELYNSLARGGDGFYATRHYINSDQHEATSLIALDGDGRERWHQDFADRWFDPLADEAAVYLNLLAFPSGNAGELYVFDGATGALRTMLAPRVLLAARNRRMLVGNLDGADALLEQRGLDGALAWTRTLAATELHHGVLTADGAIVLGNASGPIADDIPLGPGWFVAAFDSTGATQWSVHLELFAPPSGGPPRLWDMVQLESGAVAILGSTMVGDADRPEGDIDSVVWTVDRTGLRHATVINGAGQQRPEAILPARDGEVWVEIRSARTSPQEDLALQVAGRIYDKPGTYLLKLVP